jgi:hypothetical protein
MLSEILDRFGDWRSSEAYLSSSDFLSGAIVQSPALNRFLATCPPLQQGFLIDWDPASETPDYVLTNQRLWIRNTATGAHDDIRLTNISAGSPAVQPQAR